MLNANHPPVSLTFCFMVTVAKKILALLDSNFSTRGGTISPWHGIIRFVQSLTNREPGIGEIDFVGLFIRRALVILLDELRRQRFQSIRLLSLS